MARRFKVQDDLDDTHREEFQRLALDQAVTLDQLVKWLADRGVKASRGAVHNFRSIAREQAADPVLQMRACLKSRIDAMPVPSLRKLCDRCE